MCENGRLDFPIIRPADKNNNIPRYGVTWTGKTGRKCGNGWTDKATAERVRDERVADGTLLGTFTSHIAGFAF